MATVCAGTKCDHCGKPFHGQADVLCSLRHRKGQNAPCPGNTMHLENHSHPTAILANASLALRVGAAFVYALLLVALYDSLSYRWYYFGFLWANPSAADIVIAIVAAAVPAAFLSPRPTGFVQFGGWVLHYAVVSPAIVVPILQGLQHASSNYLLSVTISLCAAAFNASLRVPTGPLPSITAMQFEPRTIRSAVRLLTIGGIAYMLAAHGTSLRLASFEDVYDQRFDFADQSSIIDAYLVPIMSNVFIAFLLATGIRDRRWIDILLAIAGTLIVYSAFALKSQLISPILIFGIMSCFDKFGNFRPLVIPLFLISISSIYLIFFSGNIDATGISGVLSSLIFMRTILLPGVIVGEFASFFSQFERTYYSHSLVGRFIVDYPYGDLSVGQVVGLYMFPDQGAAPFELNGNFIATDGIAALGLPGIPISFAVAAFSMHLLNMAGIKADRQATFAMSIPYLMTLSNTSAFSSFVTGGGVILVILLYLYGNQRRREDHSANLAERYMSPSDQQAIQMDVRP
ncbi:hypothetical protein [Sphingomonas sp.]|uniref:hypothetical protein n=1 Tax=Sphingomonas sp. TaxID=28214 RepID=UPI0025D7185C|nr:hypothetical protein [Sphingomonas sp.]